MYNGVSRDEEEGEKIRESSRALRVLERGVVFVQLDSIAGFII